MTTATSEYPIQTGTFQSRFGVEGLSSCIRSLTVTMLAGWNELPLARRKPLDPYVVSLKADLKRGQCEPVKHAMRHAVGQIDAGISTAAATQWFRDAIAFLESYAARKQRRESLGVLPFPQRWERVWTRETQEQSEADVACIAVGDGSDVNKLRCARIELQEHREKVDEQLAVLDEAIAAAELRAAMGR